MTEARKLVFALVLLSGAVCWSREVRAQTFSWSATGCDSGWAGVQSNVYCSNQGPNQAIVDCNAWAADNCAARCASCGLSSVASSTCGGGGSAAPGCGTNGHLLDWALDCDCTECSYESEPCETEEDCCGFTDGDLTCSPSGMCVYEYR
jgi:hypothetical protein